MKFSCERQEFLNAVKRAGDAVSARNTIPILACLHIAATDTGLKVTGTNLDEWVASSAQSAVTVHGSACVDARGLSAWLAATPKGALITAELVNHRFLMTAGANKADFATLPSGGYPLPPSRDKGVEIIGVIDALRMCAPFASSEQTRYYLCGIAINRGHVVATDGHRLCCVDIGADPGIDAIIPNSALLHIGKSRPNARLWVGETSWHCEDEYVLMGGKLIEETFPDWTRLIPTAEISGFVDADSFLACVASVMAVANDRISGVKISANDDAMTLTHISASATSLASMSWDGSACEIGINGKYANAVFGVFAGRLVNLHIDNDRMLVTCAAMPDTKVICMGMRI